MLRSEHCIVRYDFRRRTVHPDRLIRGRHAHYLAAMRLCLRHYRRGIGEPRQRLHRAVEETLTRLGDCPPRRTAAFCKLLDDAAEFDSDPKAAATMRQHVFTAAAPLHPIVSVREGIFEHDVQAARKIVCDSLRLTWDQIESQMFGDVIELQRLVSFDEQLDSLALLRRYNLAQTQAALYRATQVRIDARADLKTIVRHVKLARLMHRIEKSDDHPSGYRFLLDGPGSELRRTTRYGVRFAAMLPMLLACRDCGLAADLVSPRGDSMRMTLTSDDGLHSDHAAPPQHDSELEQDIETTWHRDPPSGWTMARESALLVQGQTVFTPDFVLTDEINRRRIYLEVVGYWTPEYLQAKAAKLATFRDSVGRKDRWLIMVPKGSKAEDADCLRGIEMPMVVFDKKTSPKQWIDQAFLP